MKKLIVLVFFLLASCAILPSSPTPTFSPSPQPAPTITESPTAISTETPTIKAETTQSVWDQFEEVGGTPMPSFYGWKIMPRAIGGQEFKNHLGYMFTFNCPLSAAEEFYKINIPEGWEKNPVSFDISTLLMFNKGDEIFTMAGGEFTQMPGLCYVLMAINK
jgi:hypothetical protein